MILGIIINGIKSLFLSLSLLVTGLVYPLIPKLYRLFEWISTFQFLSDDFVHNVWNNIYVFVAVIVLFAIAIKLITSIVNPDTFNDNKKGVKAYYFRSVIAVVLIFIIPILFGYSYKIQDEVLQSNFLLTRVFGYEVSKGTNVGQILAWEAFSAFCEPLKTEVKINGKPQINIGADQVQLSNYKEVQYNMDYIGTLLQDIKIADFLFSNATGGLTNNKQGFNYHAILCPLAGLLVAYELFLLCMDTMFRAVKLSFLELMLPIILGAYVFNPEILKKWAKEFFSTYISLFLKVLAIGVMTVALYSASELTLDTDNNIIFTDWLVKGLFKLLFIIAILQLIKKIPDLVSTIFGVQIKSAGGIKGRLGEMAGIGGLAQKAWTSLGGFAKGAALSAAIGGAAVAGSFAKKGFNNLADNNKGKLGRGAAALRTGFGRIKNGKVGAGISAFAAGVQSKGKGTGKAMLNAWNSSPATAAEAQLERNRRQQAFYDQAHLNPTGKATEYTDPALNNAFVREKVDRATAAANVANSFNRTAFEDSFKDNYRRLNGGRKATADQVNKAVDKELNRRTNAEFRRLIDVRNAGINARESAYYGGKASQLNSDIGNGLSSVDELVQLDANARQEHKNYCDKVQNVQDYTYAQGRQNRAISFVEQAFANAPQGSAEAKALNSLKGFLSAAGSYVTLDAAGNNTVNKTTAQLIQDIKDKSKGLEDLFNAGTYDLLLSDMIEFGALTKGLSARGVGDMKNNIESAQVAADNAKKVIDAALAQLKGAEGEAIKSMSANILAEFDVKARELAEVKAKQEFVTDANYNSIVFQKYTPTAVKSSDDDDGTTGGTPMPPYPTGGGGSGSGGPTLFTPSGANSYPTGGSSGASVNVTNNYYNTVTGGGAPAPVDPTAASASSGGYDSTAPGNYWERTTRRTIDGNDVNDIINAIHNEGEETRAAQEQQEKQTRAEQQQQARQASEEQAKTKQDIADLAEQIKKNDDKE